MADTEKQEESGEQLDKNEKDTVEDDDALTIVSELDDDNSSQKKKQSNIKSGEDDKEQKRKQFFKEELKRLQKSLEKESSKIKAPPVRDHYPYCFNTLEPYYNTSTASHVIEKVGDNGKMIDVKPEYATRQTAIGLVDPWINHKMDHELAPKIQVKEPQPFRPEPKKEKKPAGGSTMTPKFPVINMDTPDLASRKLDYSDVPMLRQELREKYSSQGKAKIDEDYKRTKEDFYRMELHKLHDVHPQSRDNMKATYFAYLQNTPGSRKALKECVKDISDEDKEMQDKEKQDEEKQDEEKQDEEKQKEEKENSENEKQLPTEEQDKKEDAEKQEEEN